MRRWGIEPQLLIAPDQYLVQYPVELVEVGKTDRFPMIVVRKNSIVFGSMRTLNAVDSHAWN